MNPIPTLSEANSVQNKRIKIRTKMATITGQHHTIGSVAMNENEKGEINITANLWGEQIETTMSELLYNPKKEETRLKIGWAIYSMFIHDAFRMRSSIPDQNQAMRYYNSLTKRGKEWFYWSIQNAIQKN